MGSTGSIDKEKYLKVCEAEGKDPDPNLMPPELSDLPDEVQAAFFVYGLLQDRISSSSGAFIGKDFSTMEYYSKVYQIDSMMSDLLPILKHYDELLINKSIKQVQDKIEAEQRKAKAGSKGPKGRR